MGTGRRGRALRFGLRGGCGGGSKWGEPEKGLSESWERPLGNENETTGGEKGSSSLKKKSF